MAFETVKRNRETASFIHGLTDTPEHEAWLRMRQRCTNPNNPKWPRYGGRGITICEQWNHFENFLNDMGPKPGPSYSLGRIDSDGPYSPENCEWQTPLQQGRNTCRNHLLTAFGQTLTMSEWAERTGLAYSVIKDRVSKEWPPEKVLQQSRKRTLTAFGKTMTAKDWAKEARIPYSTIVERMTKGWPPEQVLRGYQPSGPA